jgi:hypothetical protein
MVPLQTGHFTIESGALRDEYMSLIIQIFALHVLKSPRNLKLNDPAGYQSAPSDQINQKLELARKQRNKSIPARPNETKPSSDPPEPQISSESFGSAKSPSSEGDGNTVDGDEIT